MVTQQNTQNTADSGAKANPNYYQEDVADVTGVDSYEEQWSGGNELDSQPVEVETDGDDGSDRRRTSSSDRRRDSDGDNLGLDIQQFITEQTGEEYWQ